MGFTPQFVDFDNDGRKDVLSGSWPGELYIFRQERDGEFADGETLKDKDGKPIKAGNASTVFATDWDGDDDLDLVLGNISGDVHLVTNEGTRTEPEYGKPKQLELGKALANRGGDSGPIVADWNEDGLGDLLVGMGDGSVVWFGNTGTRQKPQFEEGQELVEKSAFGFDFNKRKPGDWGARVKVHVTDWNGDGRPDLLLGDRSGSPAPKKVELTDKQKDEIAEAKEQLQDVRTQRSKLMVEIRDLQKRTKAGDDEDAARELERKTAEYEEIEKQYVKLLTTTRQETPQPQRHGFVWVFLRK